MATSEQPGANSFAALGLPSRYRARRHLASGGMAAVYCAEDQTLGRTVAIKVLAERFQDDEIAMRRFKREARAAARVSNHHHVVTIFDVGDLEPEPSVNGQTRPFIVMEYLAGGTVADAIRVGAVRRQEAVRWIREAASALDHAHVRGIVHRDIKPANFLLDLSRVLHVADFGIARLVSEDTITTAGELFGTASYLSPEQALGREATGASDRYALAVAAFELLTGQRPFQEKHFAAQARQHIEADPPNASDIDRSLPPALDPVLIRGMAKDPEQRFATAREFVDALETALSGGVPILAATAPTAPIRRRPVSRYVTPVARAAAATAAAAPIPHHRQPPAAGEAMAWTPADSIKQGSTGRRGARWAVVAAALLAAVVVAGVIVANGLGGGAGQRTAAKRPAHHTTVAASARKHVTHKRRPAHHAASSSSSSGTSTTAAGVPASAQGPQTAEQLQNAGYQEMLAGNYQSAISTLREAVSQADKGSLTYAYGLYNLGRSLVLAGDAASAVPILEERLKIPNQTSVVQQELNAALQATGQAPAPSTTSSTAPAKPTPAPKKHHPHPPPRSGGAALSPAHGAPGLSGKRHVHGSKQGGGQNNNDTTTTNFVD